MKSPSVINIPANTIDYEQDTNMINVKHTAELNSSYINDKYKNFSFNNFTNKNKLI